LSSSGSSTSISSPARAAGFFLRALIGWHFFYEGVVKLLDPDWSSAGYLLQSRWLFADFFHWMAHQPLALAFSNAFNTWVLILIGAALMLGLWTRVASMSGMGLLLLYYVANPALEGFQFGLAEGNYLFIDKNLIEAAALGLLAAFPGTTFPGLDRLLQGSFNRRTAAGPVQAQPLVPREENQLAPGFGFLSSRRELLRNLAVLPVFGASILAILKRHGWQSFEERNLAGVDALSQASVRTVSAVTLDKLKAPAPTGPIGDLRVSRIICGGNLISGFAHARDLIYVSPLLKTYFTDEKVMETLWICEASGINTAILRADQDTIRILDKYRKKGGKIQWIAQVYPRENDPRTNIDLAVDNGAVAAFPQGGIADQFAAAGRPEFVAESVDYIRRRGVVAGTAAHSIETVRLIEGSGVEPDFYMKTLHHTAYWSARREDQNASVIDNAADNYWDLAPQTTVEYMATVRKPWIAYKVLAAGAIPPAEGFQYAFDSGADFLCVGMFDFQVVENVNTVVDLFSKQSDRTRAWMA
jgi:uncharacterized membrane protein YphA (DoxX/SURF4 family)